MNFGVCAPVSIVSQSIVSVFVRIVGTVSIVSPLSVMSTPSITRFAVIPKNIPGKSVSHAIAQGGSITAGSHFGHRLQG